MSNEFIVKCRFFDKVECCFDIVTVFGNNVAGFSNRVADFGNNVERNFCCFSTLLKGRYFVRHFVRHCCCNVKQLQCRSNIRICGKNRSTCSIRQRCRCGQSFSLSLRCVVMMSAKTRVTYCTARAVSSSKVFSLSVITQLTQCRPCSNRPTEHVLFSHFLYFVE